MNITGNTVSHNHEQGDVSSVAFNITVGMLQMISHLDQPADFADITGQSPFSFPRAFGPGELKTMLAECQTV